MKVALKEDMEKFGKKGDIKEVADGYARNYLIPRGLVEIATAAVIKRTEKMRQAHTAAEAKQKEEMLQLADKIEGKSFRIKTKVGEDKKLFGSITAADIVKAIKDKTKVEIDKKMIVLAEPIKKAGEHKVQIKLATEVEAQITVKVVAE